MAIEPKTPTQQVGILKRRGLTINDPNFAREKLSAKNYYNVINAFKDLFVITSIPEDQYKPGSTFEEIFSLYTFDTRLKNLILKYILIIEQELKTYVAREVADLYNSSPYFYDACFTKDKNEKKNVIKMQENIFELYEKNKNNPMISHFLERGDMVPVWALFNTFDFGTIRTFYNLLDNSLKIKISNIYSISQNELYSMLSDLNMFRNVCAHSNRLYNFKLTDNKYEISDMNVHRNMHINFIVTGSKNCYLCGKNDLFSVLVCFKYLLGDSDFKSFYYQLLNIINHLKVNLHTISINDVLEKMGFPSLDLSTGQHDWKDILTISK